jgi:hypothetical protein
LSRVGGISFGHLRASAFFECQSRRVNQSFPRVHCRDFAGAMTDHASDFIGE